jgi:hypothetical protein
VWLPAIQHYTKDPIKRQHHLHYWYQNLVLKLLSGIQYFEQQLKGSSHSDECITFVSCYGLLYLVHSLSRHIQEKGSIQYTTEQMVDAELPIQKKTVIM